MTNKRPRTLFISDLHLQEERPELLDAFKHFLKQEAEGAEALYILGDFFNLWVGDDDPADFNRQVASALRRFSDDGAPVYLMHGNRDFLIGEDFAAACGATLIYSPCLTSLYGRQYLLMHGDSLCTDDTEYQQLRTMLRSPQWQADILAKPIEERLALAQQLRDQSTTMTSNKPEDIMDVNADAVRQIMAQHDCRRLIHGHTHRPAIHDLTLRDNSDGKRFVLGDWERYGWYLELSPEGGERLESFLIQ